jgi:hypothetical protein
MLYRPRNSGPAHSVCLGQRTSRSTLGVEPADLCHFQRAQLRVSYLFSAKHQFWVLSQKSHVSTVERVWITLRAGASFAGAVSHVVLSRSQKQMLMVHAQWLVAPVAHLHAVWYGAVRAFPRHPVCQPCLSFAREVAVSVVDPRGSQPKLTSRVWLGNRSLGNVLADFVYVHVLLAEPEDALDLREVNRDLKRNGLKIAKFL